jgi:hypothetical protein
MEGNVGVQVASPGGSVAAKLEREFVRLPSRQSSISVEPRQERQLRVKVNPVDIWVLFLLDRDRRLYYVDEINNTLNVKTSNLVIEPRGFDALQVVEVILNENGAYSIRSAPALSTPSVPTAPTAVAIQNRNAPKAYDWKTITIKLLWWLLLMCALVRLLLHPEHFVLLACLQVLLACLRAE